MAIRMDIDISEYAKQYIEARKQWAWSYEEDMRDQEGKFWRMTSSRTDHLKRWMDECHDALLFAADVIGITEADVDQLVFNLEAKV